MPTWDQAKAFSGSCRKTRFRSASAASARPKSHNRPDISILASWYSESSASALEKASSAASLSFSIFRHKPINSQTLGFSPSSKASRARLKPSRYRPASKARSAKSAGSPNTASAFIFFAMLEISARRGSSTSIIDLNRSNSISADRFSPHRQRCLTRSMEFLKYCSLPDMKAP